MFWKQFIADQTLKQQQLGKMYAP